MPMVAVVLLFCCAYLLKLECHWFWVEGRHSIGDLISYIERFGFRSAFQYDEHAAKKEMQPFNVLFTRCRSRYLETSEYIAKQLPVTIIA